MEQPKMKQPEEENLEQEVDLEKELYPQKGEALDAWAKRIGGSHFELVDDLKKYSMSKNKTDKPALIDSEGAFILNDKNIIDYFGENAKEMIDEQASRGNPYIKKKGSEYRIEKDLFKPDKYLGIFVDLAKISPEINGKVVIDKRFGKNVEEWMEKQKTEKAEEAKEPEKKEKKKKEEKKKEFVIGDEVMWKSQGEFQWEKPKKIIKIEEHKGQKFVFFEDSSTGIPMDQLISEEEKEEPEKKEKKEKPKKKTKPREKKPEEKKKKKEPEKEKPLTLDEKIAQKEKELEGIEQKYNIYYSPVVQDLLGLYYRAEFKRAKKELKGLKKTRKKMGGEVIVEGAPEELPKEEKPTVKEYLEHIRSTDKLFTEMAKVRGAVKRGEKDPSEYEKIKERRKAAYRKTIEMEKGFSDKDLKKVIKTREKERKSKGWGLFRKAWEEFWNLLTKKFGKETINGVTRDALKQQLKVVREQIKKSPVLGRAALEKEEKRLEKRLRKFK